MKENNPIKQLRILTTPNYNSLVSKINAIGIQKEDILKIAPTEEGVCLLYYTTV